MHGRKSGHSYAHYDIGNLFCLLWLDRTRLYSTRCFDCHLPRSLEGVEMNTRQRIFDTPGTCGCARTRNRKKRRGSAEPVA
jgi:cyclopropane fatty-acyl-phospholipid synthase-like methyltransferase